MAEVGNLSVRLSLDNAQFERSVASMNRTLQAMGQEIRGLQNKGTAWGTSIDGLKQKQDAYGRLLEGQQTKVRRLAEEYEKAKEQYGEHSAQAERLAVQLNRASAEMDRTERELSELTAELQRQERELAISQTSWARFGEAAQQAGTKLKAIGDNMTNVGKQLSMKLTAPIVALGAGALKSAIDFESAFAGVRKTVDATEEEFQALSDGIRDMAKRMPTAATEIATVAEAAGQLGIKKENILGFTETMVKLGTATNMGSDEAATALARLANITKMNQADFDKLGASIVALGNNFATTESEITEMALRLAGAGAQVGMSEADILGLSAALTSVGIKAEMGGSAFSRVMVNMQMAASGTEKFKKVTEETGLNLRDLQLAAGSGGKAFGEFAKSMGLTRKELNDIIGTQADLENFSKIAGMTAEQFKKSFAEDAVGAIGAFVSGLGNAEASGTTAINMLQEMGVTEIQLRDALLRAGGAAELFADAVETSNVGWEENNALNKEAEERYKTTAAQLQILKNKVIDVAISFGDTLIPMLMSVVDKITPIIDKFSKFDESTRKMIVVIGGIAAAIGPVLVVVGMLLSSVGTIVSAFGAASLAIANAGGLMGALGVVFAALTGPIAIAIGAIALIGTALVVAYANSESFRDKIHEVFNAVKDTVLSIFETISTFVVAQITKIKSFWDENGTQIVKATENAFNLIKKVIDFVMPAVLFVINYVWTAISNVITGALDVIMGVVKLFSSLFTGDFSGMWEGIKQIFFGAIDLVLGILSLTFLGGIRTIFMNLSKTAINLIKTKWTTIASTFKSFATSLPTTVSGMVRSIINFFKNMGTTVVTTVKTMATNLLSAIKELPSKFLQIGKDIMNGLIEGIKSLDIIKVISGVIGGVVTTAKSLLGIKSPSKVFKQIGLWTGEGLAIGLDSSSAQVNKAMESVGNGILSISKAHQKEYATLQAEYAKKNADANTKALDSIYKIQNTAAKKKRKLTQSEIKEIAKLENDYRSTKLKNENDFNKKYLSMVEKSEKEYLSVIKNYIEDKKSLEELSLIDEAAIWERSIDMFVEGTNERIQAQKNYQKAVEAVNKEMVAYSKQYQDEMKKISDDLIKQEEDLNKAYGDAFNKRYDLLMSFAGTFDAFKVEVTATGIELLANLQSQVDGFKLWQQEFSKLSGRDIDASLLEEISGLGVKALPELLALNQLTDEQLTRYSALYQEKSKLAREQAEAELVGMKQDTSKQILALREVAHNQLTALQNEWELKIKELTKGTSTELSTLRQIGIDAGQGLLNGLSSMQGPLISKATEIAKAISAAMAQALQIKSPSRVMKGFGVNIGQGLILGMDEMISKVADASGRLSGAVQSAQVSLSSGANANASNPSSTVTHGPTSNVYHVTIDAKNVREFNDVVQLVQGIPQASRAT